MNYNYKNNQIVKQMIQKETTFRHKNNNTTFENENSFVDILSDVAFFSHSASFEIEHSIFQLIIKRKLTGCLNIKETLYKSKSLIPDLWDIVLKYADDKTNITTPKRKYIREINVDTTLIIIDNMDDHVWKNVWKKYYKPYLNVFFVYNNIQSRDIAMNKFKKANNYDVIIVTTNMWEKIVSFDNGYNGYSKNIEFKFNRVVFAVVFDNNEQYYTYDLPNYDYINERDNRIFGFNMYCPYGNFTWVNSKREKFYQWDVSFPMSRRRKLPWHKHLDRSLCSALTVYADVNNSKGNVINIYDKQYGFLKGNMNFYNIALSIAKKLKNNDKKRFLIVNDTFETNMWVAREFYYKDVTSTIINNEKRLHKDVIFKKNINVIIIKRAELYRKDLNIDFIDEIYYVNHGKKSYNIKGTFIEKCLPFRNKTPKKINVTLVLDQKDLGIIKRIIMDNLDL